jgi:hypothetical protein
MHGDKEPQIFLLWRKTKTGSMAIVCNDTTSCGVSERETTTAFPRKLCYFLKVHNIINNNNNNNNNIIIIININKLVV